MRLIRQVADHLLDRHRAFPARGKGLRRLVAAAAANLHQLVGDTQAISLHHSLASAASIRMSLRPSSAI